MQITPLLPNPVACALILKLISDSANATEVKLLL